ncbi:alpha/beta hydrolase [Hymenobacter busanensis]|uniref:Alpha/beta hydrolase n=1 Tax=Hymenobacter busanensis TaxID=2607656 RepID=A0A7L4ZX90_9BACT|nr:alpha/beta fold hydrolase [Hymenobacter busanensis]KAA9332128.1 alpha/beta hydrolase [Hymenobacter busanensis]QHJ07533.1 alpha/beta fold hydrolase [Hymenobacter busanensis]
MFVEAGRTKLYYEVYGHGPRVVLAFHGYGQGAGHWRSLAVLVGEQVTLYAFDLFYHGRSTLAKADAPLRKPRLIELLSQFLREQNIDTFGLLAFSMGAKFALTVAEHLPERVQQLWLIAPDGIRTQFWYSLATYPPWMRGVLGQAVLRPQRLLRFIDRLAERRIVDHGLVRFAQWQLDSREKRLRVYRSWTGFRHLVFDVRRLAATLNRRPTPVTFFLGRHDKVIPHAGLQTFIVSLRAAHTVLLDTGHAGLIYDVAAYLRRHPDEWRWAAA